MNYFHLLQSLHDLVNFFILFLLQDECLPKMNVPDIKRRFLNSLLAANGHLNHTVSENVSEKENKVERISSKKESEVDGLALQLQGIKVTYLNLYKI